MGDGLIEFSERCRLCIEPKRLSIDIFSDEGRKMKLKSKINKNLPLKVSQSDGLPSQVCYQCLFRLETWVSFKQLCLERDRVMRTWSQSFLDEASSEVGRTYNSGQSNCKKGKVREFDSSGTIKACPDSRNGGGSGEAFVAASQIDDAKSDTSVWEVVKTDDIETQVRESPDRDVSQAMTNSMNSDHCSPSDHAADENFDWSKHKTRKLSKVSSSGSDSSTSNDIDQTFTEPTKYETLSSTSSPDPNKCSFHEASADADLQPLKRKRGRPSKASLQKERELKKLRDQEKLNVEHGSSQSAESKTDTNLKVETPNEEIVIEGSRKEHGVLSDTHPSVMIPEFIPVEREGVTEVVLNDPDFGSMKFTLSVVGSIDSPLSSLIPGDNIKYNSYASSTGNLSSDSLLREDFEGFETPIHSNLMGLVPQDVIDSLTDDISQSRSQVAASFTCPDDVLSVPMKRKRNISDSGDLRANTSFSEDVSVVDHEEPVIESAYFLPCVEGVHCVSRSFESLSVADSSSLQQQEAIDERNAYSDGELSESPKKRFRRKSLVTQELSHGKSGSEQIP